jgi:hypothetical protein
VLLQRFQCSYFDLTDFFYADIVFFSSLSNGEFSRLSQAFNACIRYVYCLRRFDLIFSFARGLLGCTLEEYYQYRLT